MHIPEQKATNKQIKTKQAVRKKAKSVGGALASLRSLFARPAKKPVQKMK